VSIDRSLKTKGALSRHRNVLTRAERIKQLKDEEQWSEGDAVLGLPKVAHRKGHTGRKAKAAPKKQELAEQPEAEEKVEEEEKS